MAQTIIGLDIGSFSVKVSKVTASFRAVTWDAYHEYEIPHDRRKEPERAAAEVLAELGDKVGGTGAAVICALPGDRVMTRFIKVPFNDPKKIDSILGFELEGQIPLGVEDMLYSYEVLGETEEGETEVFAAAVKHEYMEKYLERLTGAGLDPRVLTLDTVSYVNLYDHVAESGTIAFVDMGHQTTKICIVEDGKLKLARSIGRGGMAVTQAIAKAYDLSFEEAEDVKHQRGELPTPQPAEDPDLAHICRDALQPVLLAVRQTCQAYIRASGLPVAEVKLTGGGSRLRGCTEWLRAETGLAVNPLQLESLAFNKVPNMNGGGTQAAKSLGLALMQAATTKNRTHVNFRRGRYAYEGDFKFLRERLATLAALAAVLLIVGAAYAIVKNNSLQREIDRQKAQLSTFTKDNLGTQMSSFTKTLKHLKKPPKSEDQAELFPPMTAIAVFDRVTAIQMRLNRSAAAGGPIRPTAPMARGPRPLRPNAIRTTPSSRPGALPRGFAQARGVPPMPVPQPTPRLGGPIRVPRPDERFAADVDTGPGGDGPGDDARPEGTAPAGSAPEDLEEAKKKATEQAEADETAARKGRENAKIELSAVEIDVFGDVKITAETHESNVKGKESFRQQLSAERCFSQVKRRDIGEVVSMGRHADWVRFEVTFKVKCRDADGEPEKAETKEGGKKS